MARPTDTVEPALIGLTQAAQRLGIGRNTAHQLVKRGEFPVNVLTVGRRLKVNCAELEDFITSRRSGEGQTAGG